MRVHLVPNMSRIQTGIKEYDWGYWVVNFDKKGGFVSGTHFNYSDKKSALKEANRKRREIKKEELSYVSRTEHERTRP